MSAVISIDKINDSGVRTPYVLKLATYQKEPGSARATPSLSKNYAHTLLAFDGTPKAPALGMALYFSNFRFAYFAAPRRCLSLLILHIQLEDLYVSPHARKQGIGKALFAELGKVAQEKDCARLDWSVLKWNTPLITFYEKNGGYSNGRMDLEEQGIENLQKFAVHAD
ncbi:acyl-CoA N-acyltransferase [Suillus americanus]|nr:acyl-CoA N-acyltransferase [Suillus americanus]